MDSSTLPHATTIREPDLLSTWIKFDTVDSYDSLHCPERTFRRASNRDEFKESDSSASKCDIRLRCHSRAPDPCCVECNAQCGGLGFNIDRGIGPSSRVIKMWKPRDTAHSTAQKSNPLPPYLILNWRLSNLAFLTRCTIHKVIAYIAARKPSALPLYLTWSWGLSNRESLARCPVPKALLSLQHRFRVCCHHLCRYLRDYSNWRYSSQLTQPNIFSNRRFQSLHRSVSTLFSSILGYVELSGADRGPPWIVNFENVMRDVAATRFLLSCLILYAEHKS